MDLIKHWKVLSAMILITVTLTFVLTYLEFRDCREADAVYSFNAGWMMYQDYNGQYCNNIPSGIMNERYKRARIRFSEITAKKFGFETCKEYEYYTNTNYTFILFKKVTSLVGLRFMNMKGIGGNGSIHKGIDITMEVGTPVKPTGDGIILKIGFNKRGYGRYIVVRQNEGDIIYGHLSIIKVRAGQRVTVDSVIGKSGNTGKTTGPHLHIENLTKTL